ncbi:two-component regulator propeller domain-containing protein [Parapedobacter deserti]|uniref:histidine kinase n=1 Tax=Parapedobacter deserti TaxID=1912957 RepID=A0ABV7JF39_9SPHI
MCFHWLRIAAVIAFIGWQFAAGQTSQPAYSALQLDNRNGLSNSAVNCILQDRDGVLWIGTWDGLNRYDGQTFHVINFGGDDTRRGLVSNVVRELLEDRDNRIWITTVEGISRYDKATGTFSHFFYQENGPQGIGENGFGLVADTAGRLFARTPGETLMRYDADLDSFVAQPLQGVRTPLSDMRIDGSNRLWIRNSGGEVVACTLTAAGDFRTAYRLSPDQSATTGLHLANGFVFLSGAAGTLYRIEPGTVEPVPVADIGSPVSAISWYNGRYYVAVATQGVRVFDASFGSQSLPAGMQLLQDLKIRGWTTGNEQLLWVATDGNGLVRVSQYNNPFRTLSPHSTQSLPPVRAIAEVAGDLWVGTKGGGISILPNFVPQDTRRGTWHHHLNESLNNRDVFSIVHSTQNDLVYVGTDGKGLSIYDKHRHRLLNWSQLEGHQDFPLFGSVYAILEDPDGSLWVGTSGYGLIHLRTVRSPNGDIRVQFIRQYRYQACTGGLANDIVYSLCFGPANQLWVACRYGGLSLLDKASGQITNFKAFSYENSLSNNDVLSLCRDGADRLWVGTSYGLNYLSLADSDLRQPAFRHITHHEGLPNNTIHAITADDEGLIWVSTNKGLARINPDNGQVVQFQENDGLNRAEFSDGAVWKDALGYLYFGGIHGFSYFHPQQLPRDTSLPNLVIRSLRLGNQHPDESRYIVRKPGDGHVERHTLPRRENFFTAHIHALSYLYADRCEYVWMLEGHDQTWQYGRSDGYISYSNIPPGSYRLLVKWSNGSSLWTEAIPVIDLRIAPYWWQTWPFTVAVLVTLLGFAYWWYHDRKNKLNIRHRLQLERTLREKDEALHESQLNFFTHIAHELQTPLTLLVGAAEQLEHAQAAPATSPVRSQPLISLLRQHTSRLTYLVHQLLEFRKAQAGHITADYRHQDVSALLGRLCEVFRPLSAQQQNTYELAIPDGLQFAVDADKLEKIVFNLLSNAFKHGGPRKHVSFSARRDGSSPGTLHLEVANSGCRLAPQENERIFEQFQSSKSGAAGTYSTGIGLAFTRELVGVMGGSIRAAISDGWITFDVTLPIPSERHQDYHLSETEVPLPPIYTEMAAPATQPLDSAAYNQVALLEKLTDTQKKSVLVVEDEQDIRFLIRQVLQAHYIVYEACDGIEAISVLQQHPPDLVISDVMMPGMDGLTLCDKVKNTPSTCHIPFIILSAKSTLAQRNEGYEVGADAYLAKPFHASHLLVRVKNLFEQQARLHKRLQQADSLESMIRSGNSEHEKFLSDVVSAIMKHLENPELNAGMLEQALSMSKMQLYRKLKTISGMTPSEFIRHIRLRQATQLLINTQLTVNEIFYQTGFNNQSYFFREFKKQYGCSPNEYRSRTKITT